MNCIYPGSFDPITLGHIDIIERIADKFDKVIVAVIINPNKKSLFTLEERIGLIEESVSHLENVEIDKFTGLTSEYARNKNIDILIRGLRNSIDYEYELPLAIGNKELNKDLETLFIQADKKYKHISSTVVTEVASLNGDVSMWVSEPVNLRLKDKFKGD